MKVRSVYTFISIACASLSLLVGCVDNLSKAAVESELRGRTHRVHGTLSVLPVEDPSATKSAYSGPEAAVRDWTLLQFEDGLLRAMYYQSSGADIRNVDVVAGRRYDWYALANVGDVRSDFSVGTTTKTDLMTYRVRGVRMTAAQALPMAWSSEREHPFGVGFTAQEIREGAMLDVSLERIVSKYDITMDSSGLAAWSFDASSLVIRGSEDILAFSSNVAATSDQEVTDCATATDLAALNGGQAVTFYPGENKNGILLPDNRDPWAKKPASFATEHASARPTYVEITGTATLRDGSAKFVPLTYRFYLGRDNCSDFDVVRNTANTVTLVLSDQAVWDAIDEGDSPAEPLWKVEAGSFADDRSIAWSEASLLILSSGVATAGVILSPPGMSYTLWFDQDLLDAGLRVYTDAELTEDVTPSTYDAGVRIDGNTALYFHTIFATPASGTATVRTLDGRKRDDLAISVTMMNYPLGLTITGNQCMRYDGELRLTALASMADGTTVDVTNDPNTEWSVPAQADVFQSVGAEVRLASPGVVVTTLESGDFVLGDRTRAMDFSFSVGASYTLNGITATAELNSRYAIKELMEIYFTPDQISFSEGGSASNPESVGERGWMLHDVSLRARFHDGSRQNLNHYPWCHEKQIDTHESFYVKISTYDPYEAPFFYRAFGSGYLVYEAYAAGAGVYYVPSGLFFATSEYVDGAFTSTVNGNTYQYYEGNDLPCWIARASFDWPSADILSGTATKTADLYGTTVYVVSLELTPAEQTVTGLAQSEITATATFSDGSTRVVNADAEWTLSDPEWQGTNGAYHYRYNTNADLWVTASYTCGGVTVTSNPVVVHHVYADPGHGSVDHHEVEWRRAGSADSFTTASGTLEAGDRVEIRHVLVYEDGYRSVTDGLYVSQVRYDAGSAAILSFSDGYSAEALTPGSVTIHYANDDESWLAANALSWIVAEAPPVYAYTFVRLWLDPGAATLDYGESETEVLKMDYRWRLNDGPWHDETMAVNDGYGWSLTGDTDYVTQNGGTVTNVNDSGARKSVTITATVSPSQNVTLDHGSLEIPAGTRASAELTLNPRPIVVYEYRVTIDPASATISAGGTTAFTATLQRRPAGSFDGWTDLTSSAGDFVWASSNPVAAIVSGGVVTGCNDSLSSSMTDISAEYCGSGYPEGRGHSATARLSVNGKVLQSLYVPESYARPFAPANAFAFGDAIRFSCHAHYDYGADADVTDLAEWGTGLYLRHEGCVYTCSSVDRPTSGSATSFSVNYGGRSVTVDVMVYPKYVTALSVIFRDSFRASENSKPRGGLTWSDGSTATETAGGLDGYTVTDAGDPSRVWTYEPGDDVDMSELGPGTYVLTIRHTSPRYGSDHTHTSSKTFIVGND